MKTINITQRTTLRILSMRHYRNCRDAFRRSGYADAHGAALAFAVASHYHAALAIPFEGGAA